MATRTSISAEAWAGTTLVMVPPSNDSDVDGGTGGQVLQVLEFQDLVGELDDRVSSVLGCHTGVSSLALDREMEPAHALPRGLEPAVGQCGLEHQDVRTINGERFDELREVGLPISSSEVNSTQIGRGAGGSVFLELFA